MDVSTNNQSLQATNIIDNIYTKSVRLEGELSSAETQTGSGNNYEKLQLAFLKFNNIFY